MTELDDERTPTWRATLDRAVRTGIATIHTSIPAVVVSYDAATQRATVQPCIKRRLGTGETFEYPALVDVPVKQPSTADYAIHLPVSAGTEGLLHFSERSLDEWLIEGGTGVEASDPRRFDEQDGVFAPGHMSNDQALPAAARPGDALCIGTRDGSVRMEIRAGGVVTIFADEVRLGNDTAQALALAQLVAAQLADLAAKINPVLVAFDTAALVGGAIEPVPLPFTVLAPPSPPAPLIGTYVPGSVAATRAKGV